MDVMPIGTRREVCWDEALMEQSHNIRVQMHHPQRREVVFSCDKPWEGGDSGYFTLLRDAETYRVYYRGSNIERFDSDGNRLNHPNQICYAETLDGKTFRRVTLRRIPFMGSRENNILFSRLPHNMMDNVFVFRDKNPDCPPDERFKALSGDEKQRLAYFKSGDGIHFTEVGILMDDAAYDSLNICFWDTESKQYFLYYRGLHGENTDGKWDRSKFAPDDHEGWHHERGIFRDVRVTVSKDFIHWSPGVQITFNPERGDVGLYTSCIQKYYRAEHMFIGFPTRYVDRYRDRKNFPHLPDWKRRQVLMRCRSPRSGTAMTDTAIMTSRNGFTFRRTEEAWVTPGYERADNWLYGDCYFAHGMIETQSGESGGPNEISMYACENIKTPAAQLRRYTIRLDGFFSWRGDSVPGWVITKPMKFEGQKLTVNFATSALGYVQILLLDVQGNPFPGCDSGRMFGNSVDREVDFDVPLEAFSGQPVRMKILLCDADLYSFRFQKDASF